MHIFESILYEKEQEHRRCPGMCGTGKDRTFRGASLCLKRHKTAFEEWYVGRKEKVLLEEIVKKNGKKYFQGYTARHIIQKVQWN